MKKMLVAFIVFAAVLGGSAQPLKFNGLDMNMSNLSRLSDAQTRSISPENYTGAKGRGGMADPKADSEKVLDEELVDQGRPGHDGAVPDDVPD